MKKVPLFEIYWDQDDLDSVNELIKSGKFWADGPIIEEFEKKIADYLESKYCVVFNSGTSAQTAILMALGIGPGDEVIVPSFTFISTVNSVLHVNAIPKFIDIEEEMLGIDPAKLEKEISSRTKAVVPVHYAGGHSNIEAIKEICNKHNLFLIEDNAESMGHNLNGTFLGNFGTASILSFCQNKIITTGEGGGVITDSEEIYKKLKLIRSHGRSSDDYFTSSNKAEYILPGYNYRLASMNAALGISQLKKIDYLISKRRENAQRYKKGLGTIEEIIIPQSDQENHVYQLFPIICKNNTRDDLKKFLQEAGISVKIYFDPVHKSYLYNDKFTPETGLAVTEKITSSILNLPIYVNMNLEDIDFIIEKIGEFYSKNKQ